MDKQTFLNQLRNQLSGRIPPAEMEGHISYYDNYISARVRQGEYEEDILAELNNPTLIAKSIISASMAKDESHDTYDNLSEDRGDRPVFKGGKFALTAPMWIRAGVVLLIIILIIALIIKLFIATIPIWIILAIILYLKNRDK